MPNEPQQPKKPTGGPPPLPPGYDARGTKPATKSVEAPPVVAELTAPQKQPVAKPVKISLSQFYKNPPAADNSSLEPIEVEIESESTSAVADMPANPLLASLAEVKPSFDEETEDEFKLMPVEGKSAERMYSETILADIEVSVNKKIIAQEKERVRTNARAAASGGMFQFSTMQMFAGVMIGAIGIVLTRFFMKNVVVQGISFVLLMCCVVCFAMLQKTQDERVDLIARTIFLLYIASLLIGVAMS